MPKGEGYNSVPEAVAAAHSAVSALEDSSKFEYISVIFEDPGTGKFKFTDPFTQQRRGRADGAIKVPKGSARALYHNHPKVIDGRDVDDETRPFFSEGDIGVAKRTGLQSYVGAGQNIFHWDPNNPGEMVTFGGRGSTLKKQKLGKGTLLELNQVVKSQDEGVPVADEEFKVSSRFTPPQG